MTIRRVQSMDDPVVIHRFEIDPRSHPKAHAALASLPLGRERTRIIRDLIERAASMGALASEPTSPKPTATPPADDTAERRAAANRLFQRNNF